MPVKRGVAAMGLVSAGDDLHRAVCTGIEVKGRICSWDLYFPLMTGTATSILQEMNLAVNTRK
jgi:hypothetical protein